MSKKSLNAILFGFDSSMLELASLSLVVYEVMSVALKEFLMCCWLVGTNGHLCRRSQGDDLRLEELELVFDKWIIIAHVVEGRRGCVRVGVGVKEESTLMLSD